MTKIIKMIHGYRKELSWPLFQNTVAALLVTVSYAVAVMLIRVFGDARLSGVTGEAAWWAGLMLLLFFAYYATIRLYTRNSMDSGHKIATNLRLKLCDHIRRAVILF